jgi:hypothetical protein
MALEPAGYADKFGNRYEALWVVNQLLRLLNEQLRSVSWEPINEGMLRRLQAFSGLNSARFVLQARKSGPLHHYRPGESSMPCAGILTSE